MTAASGDADDHVVARRVAEEAGALLLTIRAGLEAGADPRALKDEGDLASHELMMQRLAELRPGDGVLSEEGVADPARLEQERVWIVDPLDGTREFGEAGRTDWAVHVALTVGGTPVAGAVGLPALAQLLATDVPPLPPPAHDGPPRLVVSRTRPPAVALELARHLDGELVEMGSAGAKAMAVVRGDVDVYAHAGGQYEWDSCAPVAVAAAAGLHVSRLDGSPLLYNQADPWLPDLLICRRELVDAVLRVTAS
ncbi:MAG: 3(2), 5-bisphosphate nucleotidase [Actinomycetota bacterium]|nr:3(2), 5-bisphosphate nucleotidase [Actinomycetota bacterium]